MSARRASRRRTCSRTTSTTAPRRRDRWTVTHEGTPDFTSRDWSVVGDLPDDRAGKAFFAPDPTFGTCAVGGDESSVLHLDSPVITLPSSAPAPRVVFDHWVATEPLWDGGNVKISVNGGAWQTIPAAKFVYNAYNATLNRCAGQHEPAGRPARRSRAQTAARSTAPGVARSSTSRASQPPRQDPAALRLRHRRLRRCFGWYVDDLRVLQCR